MKVDLLIPISFLEGNDASMQEANIYYTASAEEQRFILPLHHCIQTKQEAVALLMFTVLVIVYC